MADTKIRISAETAQAEAALKSLGTSIIGVRGNLVSFAGVLGGAVSVGAFGAWIKGSIDLQDSLDDLSSKTGISAADLGGLKFAADQNGASLDLVAKAVKELSVNMSATPDKFAKLGINATTATGALTQVADIVSSMPDGMQKTALLAELMGKKVGPELAAFLNQGGAALQQYIDKGKDIYRFMDPARAAEFKDQLDEMQARAQGAAAALTSYLLPGLNETAKAMNELATEGHPVLALWRGLAGMGKVVWDLLAPPENVKESLKSANRIKELKSELADIDAYLKRTGGRGDGLLGKWLHGSPEEQRKQAEILRNQIAALEKHAAELDKIGAGGKDKPKPKATPDVVTDLLGDKQKNGLEVLRSLERDYQNELAKRKDALNAPLLSASEKQLAEDLRAVHKRAQDARVELEKQNASQGLGAAEYKARLAEVTAEEEKQIAAVKELQAAQDKLNGSWEYGAKMAMRKYVDEAQNIAKLTEGLFTNAFKGMEDALVSFVQTGKLDFQSLADSIIADLIRIQVQKTLSGVMGTFFGSGSGERNYGSGIPLDQWLAGERYAGGGYTGSASRTGGLDGQGGFLAMLHPNETVIDHARGQMVGGANITYAPVIQIDSRTDRAEVERLVSGAIQRGNAGLVDTMQRRRII